MDWQQALDQAVDQELAEADAASEPSDDLMTDPDETPTHTEDAPQEPLPVFAKPSLELTGSILDRRACESHNVSSHKKVETHGPSFQLPTDTPQIRPIPSPGLPIPSPLVTSYTSAPDYFPPWVASAQPQEIRSVPAEMDNTATLPESFIESSGISGIEVNYPTQVEAARPDDLDVELVQDENVLEADFSIRGNAASLSSSSHVLVESEIDLAGSFDMPSELDATRAEVATDTSVDDAQISKETHHEDAPDGILLPRTRSESPPSLENELDDSLEVVDESAVTRPDIGNETAENEAQVSHETIQRSVYDQILLPHGHLESSSGSEDDSDDSSKVTDGSDMSQADVNNERASGNLGSPQHSEPGTEPLSHPQPTAFDQDAIDALEMMIATREEELEKKRIIGEQPESEDDIEHSSPAREAVNRPSSQGESEEEDEMSEDEEAYYEESVHDHDSQYDYDDPSLDPQSEQDDSSVDESTDEESDQEQNLPSRTGVQEVIVLDSDSDDEPASNNLAAPALQDPSGEDRSDRSESEYQADPSKSADIEMDGQEHPSPWYVDGETGYPRTVQEGSNTDGREGSKESKAHEYNHQDDKIRENSMDAEWARDSHETGHPSELAPSTLEQQDEDEELVDSELIERAGTEYSHSATRLDSQVKMPADQVSGREQIANIDPTLFAMENSQHRHQSEPIQNSAQQEALSGSEKFDTYLHDDRQIDSSIPSSPAAPEGPAPLGGLVSSSIMPQLEPQLLTPDLTQETASTRELPPDHEPEALFTVEENEVSTSLDMLLQPTGSPDSEQDDAVELEPVENVQKNEDHEHDNASTHESDELAPLEKLPATPERSGSVEVLIRTESPKPSSVLITQPPVPDRNASGLRSKLSYFAPLATLFDHYGALVDTISIVHEASPITRAKSGSKEWFVTIELTDPSMAGTTLRAQIFRRYKSSMPSLMEGTAILLRDFKVKSFNHTVMLVSVESSAWAVFDGSGPDAETNGPPVEYDSQERAYASGLRRWYIEVGSGWVADHMLQASIERDSLERDLSPSSQVRSESGSPDSKRGSQRRRWENRKVAIHELRDGTRYTDAGSPNSRNSSVHELRDGTLYATL